MPQLPYLPDTARVRHPARQRPAAVAGVVLVNLPVSVLITATARKLQKEEKERVRRATAQNSTSPPMHRPSSLALHNASIESPNYFLLSRTLNTKLKTPCKKRKVGV